MSGSKSQKFEMEMGYQTTLMYGRYTQNLGEYAKQMAADIKRSEAAKKRTARREKEKRIQELHTYRSKWNWRLVRLASFIWRHTFAKIGEDWVFLALLGMIMAILSFMIDYGSFMCHTARVWLYRDISAHPAVQYVFWVSLPVSLVILSAGFVYLVAPQAVGSGIPEMKTVLRGVVLSEYLTFRTLVAKVVGLTATLGSGMPVGKEGPLVHIASIVATLMSKLVTSFKGIYENESRCNEMLAAACAVGVSCCVGAPIGGVLFSIETTSVYFAIRNYWRGFFSAVFGALMFRLMAYWFDTEETLTAIFSTNFQVDFAYDPHELLIYALIGVFGGLSGAFFVLCHRKYVLFMRNAKIVNVFLQKNRFIYPGLLSLLIASLYFPLGLGKFLAPTLTTRQQIISLFSNFSWINDDLTARQAEIISHWTNDQTNMLNLFTGLGIYMITTFFLTLLASTLPVPSGSLIPIFKIGAAFGRIIGEAARLWFPHGFLLESSTSNILPGGYAIVGSAAFSSGVTHAISICVIVCEMTGQIKHIIPVLVAVLVSNAISTLLQPSLYDSIIMIKKLPYLPSILPSSSAAYTVFVEHFMRRNLKYIWSGISYHQLKDIIKENPKIRSLPLVDDPENMILLGSIQRGELISLIEQQIGHDRRLKAVKLREESRSSLDVASQSSDALQFLMESRPENASVSSIKNEGLKLAKFSIFAEPPTASVEVFGSKRSTSFHNAQPSDEDHGKANLSQVPPKMSPTRKISRFEVVKTSEILIQNVSNKTNEEKDGGLSEESAASQPLLQLDVPKNSGYSFESKDDSCFVIPSHIKDQLSHPTSMVQRHKHHTHDLAQSQSGMYSITTGNNAITLLLQQPKKSILKKISSFTFANSTEQPEILAAADTSNYTTITGSKDSNFFKTIGLRRPSAHHHERSSIFHLTTLPAFKKVTLPKERVIDMSPEEQKQWEEKEMAKPIDLKSCRIDPAPFQLVEKTSLLKVHSMFSLLGVHHAYVTMIGRLTGIVSLQELRKAIEDVNSGVLTGSSSFSSSSYDLTHDRYASLGNSVPGAPVEDIETADLPCNLSSSSDE